jgi:hypothetical protein
MSFWDDAGDFVSNVGDTAQDLGSSAVDMVGDAVDGAGDAAGEATGWVGDQIEVVGNAAEDIFSSGVDAATSVYDWVGNAFGDVTDWTSTAFSDAWDFGEKAASDTFDFGYNLASDGLDWTSTAVSDSWDWTKQAAEDAGTYVWDRTGAAVYGLADGAWQIAEGAWLDVTEGIGRFTRGFKNAAEGDWGQAFEDWGVGIVKTIVQTPADAILMGGGRAVGAIQTLAGLEPEGRKLNDNEIAILKSVYGDSIDYSKIIIKKGDAAVMGLGGRPFTEGNVIYIPDDVDLANDPGTLVHEACHVWQHQNGGSDYMSESLWAQNFGEGYDWKQKFDAGIQAWDALNPEQQAQFIEDAYNKGFFTQPDGSAGLDRTTLPMTDPRFQSSNFNPALHTMFLQQVLAQIKAGEGAA